MNAGTRRINGLLLPGWFHLATLVALCALSLVNLGGLIIVALSDYDRTYAEYISCRDRRDIKDTLLDLIEIRLRSNTLTMTERPVFAERADKLRLDLEEQPCVRP